MFKAIIFDFDGVLALSEEPRFKVIQQIAEYHGVVIENNKIKQMVGKTTLTFLTDIFTKKEKSLIPLIVHDYEKEFKENIIKYVKPLYFSVNFIKNYHGPLLFAIASMNSCKVITKLTNHFGIFNKIKLIVAKEDVRKHKPNKEIYVKTAEQLNILANECIVVEDTPIGVRAGLNANMRCYVIINGLNNKEEFSGLPISGFIMSERDFYNIK